MKNKFYSVLLVALVSVKPSEQYGTKGASFSGSYSSSSASSQSSSFNSSSSGSFSATGSLNEVGAGLKDLFGNLAHAGAGAGSSTEGVTNLGSYGGDGAKSGGFASAGSFASGGGVKGGTGGFGGSTGSGAGFGGSSCGFGKVCASGGSSTGIGENDGSKSAIGSGSFEGTTRTGTGGSACGFGNKACSVSGSAAGSGSFLGVGNIGGGSSFSGTPGTSSVGGTPCGFGNKACGVSGSSSGASSGGSGLSAPKDYNSALGVGGGIGVTGSFGSTFVDNKDKPLQNENIVKEIPVKENEESGIFFTGSTANSIAGFSKGGIASIESSSHFPTTAPPVFTSLDHSSDKKTPETVISGQAGLTTSGGGSYSSSSSERVSGLPELVKPTTDKVVPGQSTISSGSATTSSTDTGFLNYGSTNFGTTGTNFGTTGGADRKKPCCTGPFPGPSGSIHDSKPALSLPPLSTWGGSQSPSGEGGLTTGVYHRETGSYHGNVPTNKPLLFVPSGGSYSPSGGFSENVQKPTFVPSVPGGSYSSGIVGFQTQPLFPGPSGSIYDSKPASLLPTLPSAGGSYSSGITTGGLSSSGTGSITHTPPCCKKPFPGPSGSIHSSKPASSVPSLPAIGGSAASSGTEGLHIDTSTTAGSRPCCKGPFPGPTGSIHDYKPASSLPQIPVSSFPESHPSTGGVKPTFPGPLGSIHESKPVSSGSYSGPTSTVYHIHSSNQYFGPHPGLNKHSSPGNRHYYYVNKPDIILQPPVLSGTLHTKLLTDNYKPLNPDFIFVGTFKPGVATSGSGYATGSVLVDKPTTIPSSDSPADKPETAPITGSGVIEAEKPSYGNTDKSSVPFGTTFGGSLSTVVGGDSSQSVSTQPTPATVSGSFGSSSTSGGSSYDNGFATGNVVVQKPDGTLSGGKDVLPGFSSGTISSGGYGSSPSKPTKSPFSESNGYATGYVNIKKPSGSVTNDKDFTFSGISSSTTGSSTGGTYSSRPSHVPSGSSSFGDGYATGEVKIYKPDGSVTSGSHDSGSSSFSTTGLGTHGGGNFGSSGANSGAGYAKGGVFIQKPDGSVTSGKDLPSGGSYSGGSSAAAPVGTFGSSGSGLGGYGVKSHSGIPNSPGSTSFSTSGSGAQGSGNFGSSGSSSDSGYATGSVLIQKPDGSVTGGKDLPSGGSYSGGFSGGAPASVHSGTGDYGIKGSFNPGAVVGSHSAAGSYSGAYAGAGAGSGFGGSKSGSYGGVQSGTGSEFTGLLKGLFGKHGLGGNLGAGSGSFAKSFAGSSSYAGSSAASFSGASAGAYSGTY